MTPETSIHFVECVNLNCRLRFPLDLTRYQGRFCPKCGSDLSRQAQRLPQLQSEPARPARALVGVLDNIRSAHNVGAIFRAADGAGFSRLYLCGITPTPESAPEISKTALGAERSVPWEYTPNCPRLIQDLKTQGYWIVLLERVAGARDLFESPGLNGREAPTALVVGNEPAGVDPALLPLADEVIYLPMAGEKQSLNVSVAFGIAAYQLAFGR